MTLKQDMKHGFQEIEKLLSREITDVDIFTDNFLEVFHKYQEAVKLIMSGKTEDEIKKLLDKNTDKKIARAIDMILKFKEPEIIRLGYSLFLPGVSSMGIGEGNNKKDAQEIGKYEIFLQAFYELFFGNKQVKIDVFQEELDKNKMRKIPYKIIHFYGNNHKKTFLISNQIGEASFVYDGTIDVSHFKNIVKGEDIGGIIGSKIIYGKNYADILKKYLKNDRVEKGEEKTDKEDFDHEREKSSFDEIYYQTILKSVTDKDGKKVEVDLSNIGVKEFCKLYFGRGTIFGQVFGGVLLKKHGGVSNQSLKKVLVLGGVERPELPEEDLNFEKAEHIKEILTSIRDKDGKKVEVDLSKIGVDEFCKLYFGRGTIFGQVTGYTLLNKYGGVSNQSLKKVLVLGGVERPELPEEDLNFEKAEHIKEILKSITDKDGNREKVDLSNIGVNEFYKLYFGRGTIFGQVFGGTLLNKHGGVSNQSLKKVLVLGGVERPELPEEDLNFEKAEHIKEILKSITDKDGTKLEVDLSKIGMSNFIKLYFGRGTIFGQVYGGVLLKKHGGVSNQSLKKVLVLGGVERPELPEEDLNFEKAEHIKEILTSIRDKDGKKVEVDLSKIGMSNFIKLYFGRGTIFGQVSGGTLLNKHGGVSNDSLKKVLVLGGVERK